MRTIIQRVSLLGLVGASPAMAERLVDIHGKVDVGAAVSDTNQVQTFKFRTFETVFSKKAGTYGFKLEAAIVGSGGSSTAISYDGSGQAYVSADYDNGWSFQLGQFDTIYGFENQSYGYEFVEKGYIDRIMLPIVHQGVIAKYSLSEDVALSAIVGSRFDKGYYVRRPVSPDFGFKVDSKVAGIDAGVGFHSYQDTLTVTAGDGSTQMSSLNRANRGSIFDLTVGKNLMDPLYVGFEYVMRKDPSLKGVNRSAANGWLVHGTYAYSSQLNLAARVEAIANSHDSTKAANAAILNEGQANGRLSYKSGDRALAVTFGPQYAMTNNLKMKLDFTTISMSANGEKTKENRSDLALVYSF